MNRKRTLRAFNKIIRKVNKAIENDPLWRGRFVIRQYSVERGCDNEYLFIIYDFIDKKTGRRHREAMNFFIESKWAQNEIFMQMNTFIVNHCRVWDPGKQSPYKDETDYRKVKI